MLTMPDSQITLDDDGPRTVGDAWESFEAAVLAPSYPGVGDFEAFRHAFYAGAAIFAKIAAESDDAGLAVLCGEMDRTISAMTGSDA